MTDLVRVTAVAGITGDIHLLAEEDCVTPMA